MESNAFAPSGHCSLSLSLSLSFSLSLGLFRFFPCQLPPCEARFVAWPFGILAPFLPSPRPVTGKRFKKEGSNTRKFSFSISSSSFWSILETVSSSSSLLDRGQNTSQLRFLDHRIIGSSKIYDFFFLFFFFNNKILRAFWILEKSN